MKSTFSKDLSNLNTMRVYAECKGVIPVYQESTVFEVLVDGLKPLKILGGGSNILISGYQDAYVLKNEIKGIQIIDEDENTALVNVGAGEDWHQFVMWSLSHNLGGLENLALIPGKVGAAPIQNIGAYGVEQNHCFHSLRAIDLNSGISTTFYKQDCQFGYRDSIFKQALKGKMFITHVNYLLSKIHTINTSYGAIEETLKEKNVQSPTIKDVAEAVIQIRQSKLPDPAIIPNTGSFFKNPIVLESKFHGLQALHPNIPGYSQDDGKVKIPAAWLIDQAGLKGFRIGDAATHKMHALVLVNHGSASGKQLIEFSEHIQNKVMQLFQIKLEPEVNIW